MGLHLLPLLCDHFGLALRHFSMQKSTEMNQKLQCPISHFRQMQRKPILTLLLICVGIPTGIPTRAGSNVKYLLADTGLQLGQQLIRKLDYSFVYRESLMTPLPHA